MKQQVQRLRLGYAGRWVLEVGIFVRHEATGSMWVNSEYLQLSYKVLTED
jgi:hypothetical protein